MTTRPQSVLFPRTSARTLATRVATLTGLAASFAGLGASPARAQGVADLGTVPVLSASGETPTYPNRPVATLSDIVDVAPGVTARLEATLSTVGGLTDRLVPGQQLVKDLILGSERADVRLELLEGSADVVKANLWSSVRVSLVREDGSTAFVGAVDGSKPAVFRLETPSFAFVAGRPVRTPALDAARYTGTVGIALEFVTVVAPSAAPRVVVPLTYDARP